MIISPKVEVRLLDLISPLPVVEKFGALALTPSRGVTDRTSIRGVAVRDDRVRELCASRRRSFLLCRRNGPLRYRAIRNQALPVLTRMVVPLLRRVGHGPLCHRPTSMSLESLRRHRTEETLRSERRNV